MLLLAALGVLGALGLGLGALLLALHTGWGRESVRLIALAQLGPLLAGEITVTELTRLNGSGLGLRGLRARDPHGTSVLELAELEVDLSLLGLLAGRRVIERVELRGLRADLAQLTAERGLLAAFAPRTPSPPEPAQPAPEPLRLTLSQLVLAEVEVSAELPELGQVAVRHLDARAALQLDDTITAELEQLSTELWRAGSRLGALESARGRYVSAGAPSSLALVLELAGSRWQLEGSGLLPGDAAFETAPLALQLTARDIDARLPAALGHPEWGEGWAQPLALQLALSGSAGTPRAELSATTPAGELHASASLNAERHAQLSLSTAGLALARAYAALPAGTLQGTLTARAQLNDAPLAQQLEQPEGVPVQLRFSAGRLDEAALPELSLELRLLAQGVRELWLQLKGDEGTLELRGEADRSGQGRGSLRLALPHLERLPRVPALPRFASGALELRSDFALERAQLSAQGTLSLAQLALPGTALDSLQASFRVAGDVALPRLTLAVKAAGLRAGSALLERAELQADARRTPDAVLLALSAHGRAWGKPFELALERARIGLDGSLEVRALRASALGQRLTLSGRQSASGDAGLVLSAPELELAPLSEALQLQPPLAGTLALHATAHGTLAGPRVTVSLQGRELRAGAGPVLSLSSEAELDARQGRAKLEARAESNEGAQLSAQASAEFARGRRASWAARIDSARLSAELALQRLDLAAVEPYLAAPLPVSARGDLRLQVQGSLRELELVTELEARVAERGSPEQTDVQVQASYARGAARTALVLSDGRAPWLKVDAELAHPQQSTAALLADAAQLLQRSRWQASVQLSRRRLEHLPFTSTVPAEHRGVEVQAQLSATHAPEQEPEAQLALEVYQPRQAAGTACTGLETALALQARLSAGQLDSELGLSRESQRLARLQARSRLELTALLAGGGGVKLSGLTLAAQLEDVELSSLPYLCNQVHGRLRGSASARELLGAAPQLEAKLQAQRLSLDGEHFIDAQLSAGVQLPLGTLSLQLEHGGTRSSVEARVPLERHGNALQVPAAAPLAASVSLDRLPLAARVPESAPLSRVSGSLSGQLRLTGTRSSPQLSGQLSPEAVGFTATALAQPLSDIAGRIVIEGESVRFERLTARDGDGELRLDGRLALRPSARAADAELTLVAKEFPLRQQGRAAGELDASLRLKLGLDARAARVAIEAEDVSLWLLGGDLRQGIDLEPHPDLIDPRAPRANAQPSDAEAAAPALPIELSLRARDSIWVRREDFAAKLSAELTASSKQGQLRVHGPVILRRGYLQLLGKVFELRDRSRIDFVGGDTPDPVLDLRADADTRGQGQRVSVEITGRARAPVLRFLIDDQPVSAGEAAQALFATGAAPGAATQQVQSFVGGLSGGLFALSARRELGEMMPILLVEPATAGSGSRVRAGFELDSLIPRFLRRFIRGVYVEGIIAGADEQQQQDTAGGVLLELYLPHDLVTSGQYGPGETWSLDLGWEP